MNLQMLNWLSKALVRGQLFKPWFAYQILGSNVCFLDVYYCKENLLRQQPAYGRGY